MSNVKKNLNNTSLRASTKQSPNKRFQRRVEDFVCSNCKENVVGNGYTNHCSKCLWSRHVDVNPGDRAASCGGLMEPVSLEMVRDKNILTHRCVKCGKVQKNKMSTSDDFNVALKILA